MCETCKGWRWKSRWHPRPAGHHACCPFAPVQEPAAMPRPTAGRKPARTGVLRPAPAAFDGTYPHVGGVKVAGWKNPPPPRTGASGD